MPNMEGSKVDPLSYSADADSSVLEEIARLDGLRDRIRADQESYLRQHPEIASLLNGFIRTVVERKPADVFEFAKQHFAGDRDSRDSVDAVVVAGPSGAGKGTIIRKLMERFPQKFGFSCSHTTRGRRDGEHEGVHYHFTTMESMKAGVAKGDFIEHAEVHGNLYGTSVAAVTDVTRRDQVCVLDIDVQGVKAVKGSSMHPKYVFITPPSMEVLESRLRDRGTETQESISVRLLNAGEEIVYGKTEGNFDVVIENDDLDRAVGELSGYLREWFPKIEAAEHISAADGGDEKQR